MRLSSNIFSLCVKRCALPRRRPLCGTGGRYGYVQVIPKPNRAAQQFYEGTKKVAFTKSIFAKEKSTEVERAKNFTDKIYIGFIVTMHLLCLAAPFTFSWSNLALFGATYFITGCLGITLSFHRQLAHKSFQTPKWLEYALAYCGALAVQGDPKEWVSTHRCDSGNAIVHTSSNSLMC